MAIYRIAHTTGTFLPPTDLAFMQAIAFMSAGAKRLEAKARMLLRSITPVRSGVMRDAATTWGLRVYSRGGFRFYLGWRKRDFGIRTFYPPYVEYGTGIYGKHRRRIRPKKAKRLAWEYEGRWVSAKSIKGQKKQNLLGRTLIMLKKEMAALLHQSILAGFRKVY